MIKSTVVITADTALQLEQVLNVPAQYRDGDGALGQIAQWRQGTPDGWKRSLDAEEQRQRVRTWR